MRRLSKLFKKTKLTADKEKEEECNEAQLSQPRPQPLGTVASCPALEKDDISTHDATYTNIKPPGAISESESTAPGRLVESSVATEIASTFVSQARPDIVHHDNCTKKASLVNLPRDILLEIADVQDVSLTEKK